MSLLAGCSSLHIGPHHIDVQQGNALDQDSVARLKIGLNRSQVRFLLGTPLIVDPFRTDRWDYVYLYYKAGKLTEQKHITLFFDGDTLARIEGDLPGLPPESQPAPAPATVQPAASGTTSAPPSSMTETSIVPPLASPQDVPPPAAPPAATVSGPKPESDAAQLRLKPETDVTQIKPDAIPPFSGTDSTAPADADPAVQKDGQP